MKTPILFILLLLIFSCKKENKIADDNPNFHKAFICRESKTYDLAFYYYNLAKNDLIEINDSIGVAKSLINMAIIQTDKGEFLGGIESSLQANKYLKKESDSLVRVLLGKSYNNMAIASNYLKNFENAYNFYLQALKYIDNNEYRSVCYNNIGDLLINIGKPHLAISYLEKAINVKDSINYSKALNNIAKAKYLIDANYNPLPELNKALEIRKIKEDGPGLNSSFETLSTYYLNKDKDLSLQFARKMLEAATNNESPGDKILALKRIIILDPKNYLENFQKFNSMTDSLQIVRNKDQRKFAIIRFDVDKIKKEKEEKEVEVSQRNFGIAALGLALIAGVFLYRRRKIRLQKEKELEVKNTQLKMSKKVHDVVANGLYHMMVDVQNNPEMDKTKILNNIEKMYEESRDISHETIIEEDFSSRFVKMISSYSSEEQKVLTVGYTENIWENISYHIQLELYYILREILVNMKKHSHAKLASLKFEKNNEYLKIKYTDNGVGIDHLNQQKGAGIHNTENRIESIGGDITFEKNPSGGLIIQITIPIH